MYVESVSGAKVPCRALLDSGSTMCFIISELVSKLGLRKKETLATVTGINDKATVNKCKVTTKVISRCSDYSMEMDFLVSRKIVNDLPSQPIRTQWNISSDIELADPSFSTPGKIDMLLGAEIFFDIFEGNRQELQTNLWFYASKLGAIIGGITNQEVKKP